MRRLWLLVLLLPGSAPVLHAQRIPSLTPQRGDPETVVMTAEDSLWYRQRTSAARQPFADCAPAAFESCAAGEISARLSADGTAFGVLMTRSYDGRSAFLWRITGRVGMGAQGGGPSGGRGKGGRGGGRGGKRRG